MRARPTLDSNILVYAELEPETAKGALARSIIAAAAREGVLAVQAMLEFLAVVRRRRAQSLPSAIVKVAAWSTVFQTAATTELVARDAAVLVREHGFQVWDAVIWSAARGAGARLFLSEDLHDGLVLGGMRVANPFQLERRELEILLDG